MIIINGFIINNFDNNNTIFNSCSRSTALVSHVTGAKGKPVLALSLLNVFKVS